MYLSGNITYWGTCAGNITYWGTCAGADADAEATEGGTAEGCGDGAAKKKKKKKKKNKGMLTSCPFVNTPLRLYLVHYIPTSSWNVELVLNGINGYRWDMTQVTG